MICGLEIKGNEISNFRMTGFSKLDKKTAMKLRFFILAIFPALALSQQQGHQKQEYHMPFTVQDNGNSQRLSLTLDANWRWTHKVPTMKSF